MKNDRETYEKLYQSFGQDFKYGIYNNYGAEKDELKDLVLFYSSFEDQYTSLHEYVERMPQDQKEIYYACGDSVEKIRQLPQMERVQEKGYEVLYLTEKIDEFVVKSLFSYEDKSFQSITGEALDLDSKEEKKELDEQREEHKDLLEFIQKAVSYTHLDVYKRQA